MSANLLHRMQNTHALTDTHRHARLGCNTHTHGEEQTH